MPEDVLTKVQDKDGNRVILKCENCIQNICGMFTCLAVSQALLLVLGDPWNGEKGMEWSHAQQRYKTLVKFLQVCGHNVQAVYCNITHATVAEDFLKAKVSQGI